VSPGWSGAPNRPSTAWCEPLARTNKGTLHVLVLAPVGPAAAFAPEPASRGPCRQRKGPARRNRTPERAMIMRPASSCCCPPTPLHLVHLVVALAINMLMNMGLWGRGAWVPDLLAVVLVFWSVHQPLRIGVGVAFAFGWPWTCTRAPCWASTRWPTPCWATLPSFMHRRLLWFAVPTQAVQVFPLFLAAHLLVLVVRMASGAPFPAGRFSGASHRSPALAGGQRGAAGAPAARAQP
jgi:rod shape-determining protein MreD